MPHTNVLSLRKDHMTMYYISYSMYWICCTVLFYSIFSTKALLKYTRVANAERFCPFVRQCWTHSVFLLRRKYEINGPSRVFREIWMWRCVQVMAYYHSKPLNWTRIKKYVDIHQIWCTRATRRFTNYSRGPARKTHNRLFIVYVIITYLHTMTYDLLDLTRSELTW
jgi:hypothetical protein